jgi:DNA-directed RNA polymerase specialized sigma24 family protein
MAHHSQPVSPSTLEEFTTFLEAMQSRLHTIACKYARLLEPEDTEQEARLALWVNWSCIRSANDPLAMGYTVASRAVSKIALRSKSVRANTPLEVYGRMDRRAEQDHPKRLATPLERKRMLAALDQLSPHQRISIMSFYRIEDRNHRSPDPLARNRKTNDSHRCRGLQKLRSLLASSPVPESREAGTR